MLVKIVSHKKIQYFTIRSLHIIFNNICRWDHSENFYVMQYTEREELDSRETDVTINILDEDDIYLKGHVVNEKNLYPAMGYIFLIWKMIAAIEKQEYINIPVIFEDVNFIRATVLSEQNIVELKLSIMNGNISFLYAYLNICKYFNQE